MLFIVETLRKAGKMQRTFFRNALTTLCEVGFGVSGPGFRASTQEWGIPL